LWSETQFFVSTCDNKDWKHTKSCGKVKSYCCTYLCFFYMIYMSSSICLFTLGMSLPPRSSNSTPISQPTNSINPSMPFTSSPDAPPSQNPLSLIMSQMSKYAMPSSTPLYHDAIKTIATSDDEMLPDRPLLPGINMSGTDITFDHLF